MKIKEEFDRRLIEIATYFEILESIEMDKPRLTSFDLKIEKQKEILFDSNKINIFRASAILLLYNLVESTIYNSVVSIFDEISTQKLKYFEATEDIRKYWLNNVYKHDEKIKKETVINSFINIANQIFNDTMLLASNQIEYGGSLDADKIFKTANSLKIDIKQVYQTYRKEVHGETLEDIKKKRNWLAHGEKTFAQIGQDYSFSTLENLRKYVIEFLENYINCVENYIFSKHYKIQSINNM